MSNIKAIAELKNSIEEFRLCEFPENSYNETVSDLFMDLVAYDSYIAGLIDRVSSGHKVEKAKLIYDDDLERKLEKHINGQELWSEDKNSLIGYLKYLRRIKQLLHQIEGLGLTF
jgi:hypothetical protein